MSTCETCVHRTEKFVYSFPTYYRCNLLSDSDENDIAFISDDYPEDPRFLVRLTFGCNQYQPRKR
jgi:hypothetical protein